MIAIVAVEKNWGIGKDGDLLVRLPKDLAFFKESTMGNITVMGRRTAESLPGGKPLPGREAVVLTRKQGYKFGDAVIVQSTEELLDAVSGSGKDVYVCGGGQIYEMLLPYCDRCLITRIDADIASDTSFPNLDAMEEFEVEKVGEPVTENGFTHRLFEYRRKNKAL
jgi:dihydrofolate reductase